MNIMIKRLAILVLFLLLVGGIIWLFPWLFVQVASWQKDFNQLISNNLHQIQAHSTQAGIWLILVSFAYGVLHALGPGHGKFIIASYLSTHETQLKASLRLSLLSSLMQGIVAIVATSIVVVILKLSSHYFKLSQLWLERAALILLILLGVYWCYQGIKSAWQKLPKRAVKIRAIYPQAQNSHSLNLMKIDRPLLLSSACSEHHDDCGCGHQHLPTSAQLQQAKTWKSQCLVILSIGMRPCSGAIFVLFLAYMLDVYAWGILATIAMSFGTGLMLSGFAIMVRYARKLATQIGHWYQSPKWLKHSDVLVKCLAGGLMIFFALSLFYATLLPASGGAVLFR